MNFHLRNVMCFLSKLWTLDVCSVLAVGHLQEKVMLGGSQKQDFVHIASEMNDMQPVALGQISWIVAVYVFFWSEKTVLLINFIKWKDPCDGRNRCGG